MERNVNKKIESFSRKSLIGVLVSWLHGFFFRMRGAGGHSPTWHPWKLVVLAAGFVALEISGRHPQEGDMTDIRAQGDRQALISARSTSMLQDWGSKFLTTSVRGASQHG